MVTVVGKTAEGLGVYRGLSTDLPLDPAPKNGSRFFAMDNGKTYWYDAASDTWEGYSGGGAASDLSDLNDVDLEGLTDGDFLKYDEDLNKWVPGTGASISGYVFDHEEVITETNQSTIVGTRLKNIADAALSFLSNMGADKIAFLACFKRGTVGFVPRSTMYGFTNSILSFDENFFKCGISGAQNITRITTFRITNNAANTEAKELQLATSGAGTYVDDTSATFAEDFEIHFMVFKQA